MAYPDFTAIEAQRAAHAQEERDARDNNVPWLAAGAGPDGSDLELTGDDATTEYNKRIAEFERVRDKYYELLHLAKFPGIAEWQVIGKSNTRQNGEPYVNLTAAQIAKVNDLATDTLPSGIQMKFLVVQCGEGS